MIHRLSRILFLVALISTTVFDAEKAGRLREALSQMLQAFLEAARDGV